MSAEHCVLCSDGSCPTCQPPPQNLDKLVRNFAAATGTSMERAREVLSPRPRQAEPREEPHH